MLLPFVGGAYKAATVNLNAQTCINLYPVRDEQGGKTQSALYRTPGLTLFSDDSEHACVRGLFESNDVLYGVIDSGFYRIDTAGNRILLGTLLTSIGYVSIESNSLQLMIVDGANLYVYTLETNTFEINPAEDFQGAIISAYQDGYGILPKPNTTTWYITDLFDFSVIDPLDFANADTDENYLVSVVSRSQEVWLLKRNSAEVWYDTGQADFPFQRRQTLIIRYGIVAPYSLVRIDNSVLIWLARNEHSQTIIVQVNGYEALPISDEGVNVALDSYDVIDDAFAFAYEQQGHLFYVITFPTADRTWVYDLKEKEWHERRSQIDNDIPSPSPTRQGRWRPNCYAYFNNKHVVGDFESGKLFYLDLNTYTENGTTITLERTGYHFSDDEKYLPFDNVQLIAQTGVGLNSGQGEDPQVMLQVSKNGGHSFGTEKWRSLGKQGKYRHRVKWNALGIARDWVYRVRITDPVNVRLLGLRANVSESTY